MGDVGVEIRWMEGEEKLCHLRKGGDLKIEMTNLNVIEQSGTLQYPVAVNNLSDLRCLLTVHTV